MINKAAREIARVGGAVTVTGHTDSQPIHSAEFPSTFRIAVGNRAAEVAALLTSGGVLPPDGTYKCGKAIRCHWPDNGGKPGGRNRRVEILVVGE